MPFAALSLVRPFLSIGALLLLGLSPSFADENPYDTLGKVITPLAALMAQHSSSGNRAFSSGLRVEESHGYTPELTGAQGSLSFEYPDKLSIEAPLYGEKVLICRHGPRIWAYPGSKLKELLARPEVADRLPPPDRKFQLHPFSLPVPEKQMVFLPALFQSKAAPDEAVDETPCRVIDVQVTPFVAASAGVDGWSSRLWVDAGNRLLRLRLQGPETSLVVRLDNATYGKALPPATWVPTKAQQDDVVIVPAVRYDQLLRAMLGGK